MGYVYTIVSSSQSPGVMKHKCLAGLLASELSYTKTFPRRIFSVVFLVRITYSCGYSFGFAPNSLLSPYKDTKTCGILNFFVTILCNEFVILYDKCKCLSKKSRFLRSEKETLDIESCYNNYI
jgi:hypothetical protein